MCRTLSPSVTVQQVTSPVIVRPSVRPSAPTTTNASQCACRTESSGTEDESDAFCTVITSAKCSANRRDDCIHPHVHRQSTTVTHCPPKQGLSSTGVTMATTNTITSITNKSNAFRHKSFLWHRSSSLLVHLLLQLSLVCQSNASETLDSFTQFRQINLVQELNLHNFSYSGLSTDRSHSFPNAIYLYDDSSRNVRLNSQVGQRAANLISQAKDVTFLATIRQSKGNTGALFAFTDGIHRVLEIQSSGRRKELRFQYRQHETVFSETFDANLADDAWHKVALTVSDVQLDLYIDCVHRFRRQILPIDTDTLHGHNLTLWLGQRGDHFMYQGYLRDVQIVSSANAFRAQCPDLETACPTCGQFRALKDSIFQLENTVKHLTEKLRAVEQRMANVESCDCVKGCRINGTVYPDGFVWRQNCDNCICSAGRVTCKKIKCENSCKNAQQTQQQDECCPKCKKQCYQKGRGKLNEGERFVELNARKTKCNQCVCDKDGKLNCRELATDKCPKLNCTNQIRPDDQCCNICEGTDFCALGHTCHKNAECRNLRTNYTCVCKAGFHGNGHTCEDIDECGADKVASSHRCINAECVNTVGSYECRCKSGFTQVDQHRCIDIDECSSKQHMCHENAECLNTPGDYQCKCREGFEGDGRVCKPVCKHSCLNGGQCVAPNTCSCRKGYYGHRCQTDIDECALGLYQCPGNSKCVNKPGWYHCECNQGYESIREPFDPVGTHELQCRDINECASAVLNTCGNPNECVNFDGGYRCECGHNHTVAAEPGSDSAVRSNCGACVVHGVQYGDGHKWPLATDHCTTCECSEGVVRCTPPTCDCSLPTTDRLCCPHCNQHRVCLHQEDRTKHFKHGQQWQYDCQTCECMNGEIDCWSECPPVNCLHPIRSPGDCCLRCEDDPCQSQHTTTNRTNMAVGCRHLNKEYRSGQVVTLHSDKCTSCLCQNGRLCCSYTSSCLAEAPEVAHFTDSLNVSLHSQYSVKESNSYEGKSAFDSSEHYIERFLDKEHGFDDNRLDRLDELDDDVGDASVNSHELSYSHQNRRGSLSGEIRDGSGAGERTVDKREENDRSGVDLPDWSHELATT